MGPFIPMPDMTQRQQQQPQQVQAYKPEEEEEEEWYEAIPLLGGLIGIGDDIFGDEEKKGQRDSVGSVARGLGGLASMFIPFFK